MEAAFELFRSVVAAHGLPTGAVDLDAHLFDDLGFDSFDAVDILIGVEAAAGLTVDTEALLGVETVRDFVAVIDAALSARSRPCSGTV